MISIQPMNSIEMIRTNPAHAGTSSLSSLAETKNSALNESNKKLGTFESYLVDAVSSMNDQQLNVSSVQEKLITDPDSVDVHDVTTAMAKAQMSLSLAQTVIDRIVTGWSEITTTR